MPQSFLHRPAGPPAAAAHKASRRWAPNIPGSLTRSLSRCLGVDACAAMRIALLYGDMEWRAGGAALLHYSASDYARRQGLHRQTVHADIRRLQSIGAITVSYDRCRQAVLELHGLGCLEEGLSEAFSPANASIEGSAEPELEPSSARSFHRFHDRHRHRRRPCRPHHHPCRSNHQSPGDAIDQTLSIRPPTLEKGLKTQEKRREERNSQQPPHQIGAAADQEPSSIPPEPGVPSEPCQGPSPCPKADSYRVESPGSPSGLPSRAKAASQKATAAPQAAQTAEQRDQAGSDAKGNSLDGLMAELLDTFRSAAPAEWPTPRSLTLTTGRRTRLKACLAHAGSRAALVRHLRLALAQVPPWFRSTYPVRPDGSRRPSHQFFDLLFRATAADRDGGPEAWHVFAWSEAGSPDPGAVHLASGSGQAASPGALRPGGESDLHRAQRLFGWGGSSWLLRDIEALQIPLAERRRLTALLESQGQGIAGAGASQFAEPSEPMEPKESPASCPAPTTPKGRHRPVVERDHGRPGQACAAFVERP